MEKKLINEKTVEHLLELSRLKIDEKEKEKLVDDLNEILNYVKELEKIPTENINLDVIKKSKKLRSDKPGEENLSDWEKLIEGFKERKEAWLKIPPVFDR